MPVGTSLAGQVLFRVGTGHTLQHCTAANPLPCPQAQLEPFETPMQPITVMRNALISEGGSGVPINRDAYAKSVAYWSQHAVIGA